MGRPGLGIWLKKAEEDIRGNFFKGEGRKAKKKRYVYADFTNSVKADVGLATLLKCLTAKRNIVGS